MLEKVIEQVYESVEDEPLVNKKSLDNWTAKVRTVLIDHDGHLGSSVLTEISDCFSFHDAILSKVSERKEFKFIESFIIEEENLGRQRRKTARKLSAVEESNMASDIAQLKGFRLKTKTDQS